MIDPKTNPTVDLGTRISPRVRLGRRTTIPKDIFFGHAPFPLFVVAATAALLTGFAGNVPFPPFTIAAAADTPRSVQGAIAFPQPTATGIGQIVNSGSAIATLPTPNIVSAGETVATSTASIAFPSVTVSGEMVSGSGFAGAIAFPQPTVAGVGQTVNSGTATLTMPLFIPSGSSVAEPSLSGNAAFPLFVVNGAAESSQTRNAAGSLLMPTPVALGGATVIASGQGLIPFVAPSGSGTAEVIASGQGAATMPLFVASGTAEGEISRAATGAILFNQPAAAATAGVTASGLAAIGLTTPQPSGTANVETDATGSATFPGFVVAGTADGGASSESISATSVALRTSQLQDASVMGDVDWWVAGVDEKLNGTEITVTGGTLTTSTGAPVFKFNDGTTNTGDQQLTSQYQFGTIVSPLITIAIPAGTGRVSVWVGTGSSNDATFAAAFGLNTTGLINFSGDDRFDIDFAADSASTMAIMLAPGSNADVGVYAVSLATDAILTGTPAPDILWWPTTEAAGTNIYDPVNGWIGFFEGTTISWDTDNFLLWAGGYVRNNNNALESLIETTSTGTAMCWVNPNDLTTDSCIFTAKNNTTNEGRMYFLRGDPVGNSGGGTNVYKGGYRTSPTSGAQGVQFESANNDWQTGWHHIAMSFATGSEPTPRFQFWKDGVLLPQANYTFYPTQFPDNTLHSQGNFIYGQQGNAGNPFSGKLYDLRLYERELETVEIQRIFDATRGVVGVT